MTYASGEFRTLNRTSCRSMVYRQLTAYRWAARNDGRSAEGFAPCLTSFRKSVAVSPPLPVGELDFKSACIKSIIWAATTGPTPGVPSRQCRYSAVLLFVRDDLFNSSRCIHRVKTVRCLNARNMMTPTKNDSSANSTHTSSVNAKDKRSI
jgi:hypothetical protein